MQHDTEVRLTHECERELLRKAQAGDSAAVDTLVLAFRPLVEIVVRKQYKCSYSDQRYDDMYQDGIVGLYSAIQKYNLEYSVRLSTYAVHWIRRQISYSLQSATVLAEPYGTAARRRLVRKVQEELQKSTPSPSPEAIAARSGLSLAAVKHHVFGIGTQSYSLDAHFETEDGTGSARGHMLRDNGTLLPEEYLLAKEELMRCTTYVRQLMEKLEAISSARNADIFLRRNTLSPYENTPHSLDDIAVHYGITRERVRQIVEGGWRRLRLGSKNFTEVELRRVQQALLLLPELDL